MTLALPDLSQLPIQANLSAVAIVLVAMAAVALIETAIPLRARTRWSVRHLGPNLALTFITFATNIAFNIALVLTLAWFETIGFGLAHGLALHPWAALVAAVLVLDFSTYVAHIAMHEIPGFWRYHRVHHADPAVDVTTTIRQHPGEGIIRYAFLTLFAIAWGAGPAAFAIYRVWSALQGLIEHANIRLPLWLDTALSLVITSPNMHKVHHSRDAQYTDTNYGNITSLWDRLFFTFTPARRGLDIDYGLEGFDEPADQTAWGLIALPWRERGRTVEGAAHEEDIDDATDRPPATARSFSGRRTARSDIDDGERSANGDPAHEL